MHTQSNRTLMFESLEYIKAAQQNTSRVLENMSSDVEGLRPEEVLARRTTFGPNSLQARHATWHSILLTQFKSPFLYLLLAAAILSLIFGEKTDGFFIFVFVCINATIGFVQEYKADRSVRALQSMVTHQTHVRRTVGIQFIASAEIVPGDILVLEAGDTIPADVRFIEAQGVAVDESVLTGESVPIDKHANLLSQPIHGLFQAANIGFSGTTLVSGKATGVVIATGSYTMVGKLEKTAIETDKPTAFSQSMSRLSIFILRLVGVTLVAIILFHLFVSRGEFSVGTLIVFAIALAVGVIPEALPLVITVSLAQGAMRLARLKVVPRRLSAIADLGGIDVLCTDKTGTITENMLRLSDIFGDRERVLRDAALASAFFGERIQQPNNAFDLAIWKGLSEQDHTAVLQTQRIADYPFDPIRRRNSVIVEENKHSRLIVRGAPETVIQLLQTIPNGIQEWLDEANTKGHRILMVATREVAHAAEDSTALEQQLVLLGCVSFEDPIKSTTTETIKQAKELGVQIKILTGDSVGVATSVARQIGLIANDERVMTGDDFANAKEGDRHQMVERSHVFARMTPDMKLDVIKLLEEHHTVGFLGEGFNDAPALKLANVAISVEGASDIAQHSSDIILLNKSLHVIIDGIREGRRTFSNTLKYIKSTLASNLGNFFAIATASLIVPFLPMLPVQILLVNLLTDFPLISIATDAVDETELQKPETYRMRDIILMAVFLGFISSLFDFLFFGYFVRFGETTLQTAWFVGSVLTELVLLFSIRTRFRFFRAARPSLPLSMLTVTAVVVTVAIVCFAASRSVFHFGALTMGQWSVALLLVAAYFVATERTKLWYYHLLKIPKPQVKP